MFKTRTLYLLTALTLGLAAIEPSSADSHAKPAVGQTLAVPSLAQDYWSASRGSFRLANEYRQQKQTLAACQELAKSLDYYRKALAQDTDPSAPFAFVNGDHGDGMQQIRSWFGCTRTQLS